MPPRSLHRALTLLSCIAMSACATSAAPGLQTVGLETEFMLAPSGKARIKGSDIEVQFLSVTEDSRCPREVACVWVGQAKVRLDVVDERSGAVMRDILEQQSVIADEYEIKIVRVLPYPTPDAQISPSDYRVTLLATRN